MPGAAGRRVFDDRPAGGGSFTVGKAATRPARATTETGNYRLELDIADPKQMYSKADAVRQKSTSGAIMVSGQLAGGMASPSGGIKGMPGMAPSGGGTQADPAMRQLELHVRSKSTGRAVGNVKVFAEQNFILFDLAVRPVLRVSTTGALARQSLV
jgi:hypothetical protein